MEEKLLTCKNCKNQFVFSVAEQLFFESRQLQHEPKNCTDCRLLVRAWRKGEVASITEVSCTECGATTRVPFEPKGHRPIYCLACMHAQRVQRQAPGL